MYSGFDYGTSNCAIGVMNATQNVQLLSINQGKYFMPSTLYALERELITEHVGHNIPNDVLCDEFLTVRKNALSLAQRVRREHDIDNSEQSVFVGQEAFDHYLAYPGSGYFVKSPKSFLGASGLRPEFMSFFEDLVCAMMQAVKQRAEQQLGNTIEHTVIGRPVNFQGMNAETSNRQAIDILTIAAKRAGFQSIEFLFEPLAAAMDFESRLNENQTVLVVDIGGGTTDCAMVRMGPDYSTKTQRDDDFLGHSGERVGGNDLDIQLAGKQIMPLFGMNSFLKNGQPMPTQDFWNAVRTNNIAAQTHFTSLRTEENLEDLLLDTTEPELLKRFIRLREEKQNYHIVRNAEQCKIALSESTSHDIDLDYIEHTLSCSVSQQQFEDSIEAPLEKMVKLMEETIKQAGCQPGLIYITGGSAKSPAIRRAIEQKIGSINVIDGDHFGSVASGLVVWADRLFR